MLWLMCELRTYLASYKGLQMQYVSGIPEGISVTIPSRIVHSYRDNYNSLTSAKFPPKDDDGQLKFICVDKKADKINILIDKVISVIRTMAALEVMITVYPRVV